jgi:uncharacterized damage-inducible protein DinB
MLEHNAGMIDLPMIRTILRYGDWANEKIVGASTDLADQQLDRVFDIGRGSLRKTLLHILAGESVWLRRWQEDCETPWPSEDEPASPATIAGRFAEMIRNRDRFFATIDAGRLTRAVVYRDSKGGLYSASLGDMMLQMCLHSTHHRAQAVNILRRLDVSPPELDYMMWVRKPV